MEVRFLRAMCEIAISCLQKCPQASVLRAPRKKRSRFLRPPIQVGSENLGCSGACLWSCRWIVGCSSWTAPRSGRSGRRKKKRREDGGKFGRRGNHVKIVWGKKRRGGRKKEEERTFEAAAQVHFLAAGENPAEHPAKQQHLKFPLPCLEGGT